MFSRLKPRAPRGFEGTVRHLELSQSSFANGPVFIDEPDTLVTLTEDVSVNFSNVEHPPGSPFHLGWFGAIIVRASRVRIDLQGFTLRQARSYRLVQRFFALVDLCNTPLPDTKGEFTTQPHPNDDIVVRNGRLSESSHFCIHAVVSGRRWVFEDLEMDGFEVGAVSVSESRDLVIRRCAIGSPMPPGTSAEEVMMRDLARRAIANGNRALAQEVKRLTRQFGEPPAASDALVRCIVIMPFFNVGKPELARGARRISRIAIHDVTFADIRAQPVEVVGIEGEDGEPLKDIVGNLIAFEDAAQGKRLSWVQAALTPNLPPLMRQRLLEGSSTGLVPLRGRDRRGHDLLHKASVYVRCDGCDGLTLRDLICGTVSSHGDHSAAVGVMLNDCSECRVENVHVQGVRITDACVSALSDLRPQSGLYVRSSHDMAIERFNYGSKDACSCSLRDVRGARLAKCAFSAPMTALRATDVRIDD